jgi:hypothetical protein
MRLAALLSRRATVSSQIEQLAVIASSAAHSPWDQPGPHRLVATSAHVPTASVVAFADLNSDEVLDRGPVGAAALIDVAVVSLSEASA